VEDENIGRYEQYTHDAGLLGKIGAALFPQPTTLSVRLPKGLADLALAAWCREIDQGPLGPETAEQRTARYRAGTLALIGLCVENTGRADGDEIICELDAWYIGAAFEAADEHGLLADKLKAAGRGGPESTAVIHENPPDKRQD
jgi:hypothetical protein